MTRTSVCVPNPAIIGWQEHSCSASGEVRVATSVGGEPGSCPPNKHLGLAQPCPQGLDANKGGKSIWVLVVVGMYVLAMLGVLGIFGSLMATGKTDDLVGGGVVVATFLISQAGLLLVPARLACRRPVRRRILWFPLITSGALFALLVLVLGCTAACRLGEILEARSVSTDYYADFWFWAPVALALASWIAWVAIYYRSSASQKPEEIALTLHRRLLQGSVLQLLISGAALAAPHDWSFAFVYYPGFHLPFTLWTMAALVTGVCIGPSVMFLALGPAVAMLYLRCWMNLQLASGLPLSPHARKRRVLTWSILAGSVVALLLFSVL